MHGRAEALAQLAAAIRRSPHNLLSPRGVAELESRHLPECVAFAATLPPGPASLIDIGSGAGLPGLVIAIERPDLTVTLLEATRKKAAFLRETADALGLAEVEVIPGRAEQLGRTALAGGFDLATARAVAPLARLVAWALPLLRPGGTLHAIKGERWEQELADAAAVLASSGARVVHTPVEVPPVPQPRVVTIARA